MPKPQYNVQLIDGMPTGYYNRSATMLQPKPIVNPIKNWWNSVVNNARQNAFNPVNNWETVAPNVPAFKTNPAAIQTDNIWNTTIGAIPQFNKPYNPLYSITKPFPGVNGFGPTMPTAYGTNTRRGSNTGLSAREMMLMQIYGTPAGEDYDQYDIGGPQQKYLNGVESLESLIARGAVDPYGHDPYEVGGSPYQQGVWVRYPELPPYQPGGGGYGGGGGGSYDYFSRPSSPSYTGYGGNGYASMPQAPNYTGYSSGYYSLPSSGGYGGGGGSGYYSMPQAPNYTGYGRSGYELMPQAPTYRGRGGRNQSSAPATAYYRGINSGGGYGGGYAGGQSQRGAWYGALLQWNI